MDYLPSGHARTDPIITKTCLSDHVHTFYGPQAVHPETDYDTLINTRVDQNTGNVEENKSLYWHPTVYSYDRFSNTYTRDEIAQTSAYYIWENDADTKAFPHGFQMIGGLNPSNPANFPNPMVECVDPSPCTRADCYTENTFFPSNACAELEVSMSFPTCWDGRLDSDDHVSHVHYTLDGELDGPCPGSHPLRIPQIQLFFRIMPYDGGWHTFSDGSSVYHADYMSGWDETFLQGVLDNCVTDSFAAMPNSFCESFLTFRDGPKCTNEDTCDFGDPNLLAKLKAFQPPPLDIHGTVTAEETNIVNNLPRGTCTGNLIPLDGSTSAPIDTSPTNAPVQPPTQPPMIPSTDVDSDVDETDNGDTGMDGSLDDTEDEDFGSFDGDIDGMEDEDFRSFDSDLDGSMDGTEDEDFHSFDSDLDGSMDRTEGSHDDSNDSDLDASFEEPDDADLDEEDEDSEWFELNWGQRKTSQTEEFPSSRSLATRPNGRSIMLITSVFVVVIEMVAGFYQGKTEGVDTTSS